MQHRQASALKLQRWIRGESGRRRAREMRRLLEATRMVQKATRCGFGLRTLRDVEFCCSILLTATYVTLLLEHVRQVFGDKDFAALMLPTTLLQGERR